MSGTARLCLYHIEGLRRSVLLTCSWARPPLMVPSFFVLHPGSFSGKDYDQINLTVLLRRMFRTTSIFDEFLFSGMIPKFLVFRDFGKMNGVG